MNRIFKYPLAVEQREMIYMPRGAQILSVAVQQGTPVLFALVDEGEQPEPRIIRTVTTGDEFNAEGCSFIGTVQMGEPTWFVAHVFEQGVAPDQRHPRFADDFREIRRELTN